MSSLRGCRTSILLATTLLAAAAQPAQAATCDELPSLTLRDARITAAVLVDTGTFSPPTLPGAPTAQLLTSLPPFCRVSATVTPTADSDIRMEVWMPVANWNGKFVGVGNGGLAGTIPYPAMAPVLARGFAVASSDTGHRGTGADGAWALGHPEQQIDFGHRAVHETTVTAKAIVRAYYSAGPRFSYFTGCSTGGRQGLVEAQRYPGDYDGIVSGAPVNDWNRLVTYVISIKDAADTIPPAKYATVHKAAMAACDARDGVADNVLENPIACSFDPATIACTQGNAPGCLTAAEVAAVKTIYGPLRSRKTGRDIFPGLPVGSELNWPNIPRGFATSVSYYRHFVFADPAWDYRTMDPDADLARAEAVDANVGRIAAMDADLSAFRKRGGKLIQFHGFGEPEIPPLSSIDYRARLIETLGASEVEGFYRLFMVPGMAHCRGGVGATDQFDLLGAIDAWVEKNEAPNRVIASRVSGGRVDRTRPLCNYPQVARYAGTGSTDDAANFACVVPR